MLVLVFNENCLSDNWVFERNNSGMSNNDAFFCQNGHTIAAC